MRRIKLLFAAAITMFLMNGLVFAQDTTLTVTSDGNVGIGTASPNEQLEITGNFRLPKSTASVGVIKSEGDRFIHNFGVNNFFAGVNAGNLTMGGAGRNTGVGVNALQANTTGNLNTANGFQALQSNTTGGQNTAIGDRALSSNTTGSQNTAAGEFALRFNTTGGNNTASGRGALSQNTTGVNNTAVGKQALSANTTGGSNTAIGSGANVSAGNLVNATAIGLDALVNASHKIRLGNSNVSVIEGQVAYTFTSDANLKENFRAVDGEDTLEKISLMTLESWNYKGHDPLQLRHYGSTAQEFFAAFGDDGFGVVGTETTINSGDMAGILMIAVQALEKRTARVTELEQLLGDLQEQIAALEYRLTALQ